MIHLHTLGDARIRVGAKEVRPTAPMIFAALLYLSVERGRRVPRAALQELLFPESDERSGAHSLRQLLYRLRQLGAPVEIDEGSVFVAAEAVHDPLANGAVLSIDALAAGYLPGYSRPGCESFLRWLDGVRDGATIAIAQQLRAAIARARDTGDHNAILRAAAALLELDPLNEDATLARAESLALTGSKHEALRILESYSAEVGAVGPELRQPAQQLRRRIAERVEPPDPSRPPLVGRTKEMGWLNAQHRRASHGHPTVSVVWGDAGIGKTRLVQEFTSHLRLGPASVVTAQCQPHDSSRPLGAISDFVPQLLQARGALGVSPESMSWLRRLDSASGESVKSDVHPAYVAAQLRAALVDLLTSIASEGPLVMVVEDTHWLDEASARFLLTVVPAQESRLHVVMTSRPQASFFGGIELGEHVFVSQLMPLDHDAAGELLSQSLRDIRGVDAGMKEECLKLGAGNPLFLRSIGEHLHLRGALPSAESSISELLVQRVRVLDAGPLLMLRATAVLAALGTFPRITACSGQAAGAAMLALQALADRRLVVMDSDSIRSAHDLLSETVLADTPRAVRAVLHERAAITLEEEGTTGRHAGLLWTCAEHWLRAERGANAASVLRRCGLMAAEIGQTEFASAAMDRAEELCDPTQIREVLEDSIRVSEYGDHERVLRCVSKYRKLVSPSDYPFPDFIDLVEMSTVRRQGFDVWTDRERLRKWALSSSIPVAQRFKALRMFIGSAAEALASDQAREIAIASGYPWTEGPDSFTTVELRMVYEFFVGDMALAAIAARQLVRLAPTIDIPRRVMILSNAARALLAAGDTREAIEVCHLAVATSEKVERFSDPCYTFASMTDCYLTSGDLDKALTWRDKADAAFRAGSFDTTFHLSNRVWCAMACADFDSAERALEDLKAQPMATQVHAQRSIRGMEILIAAGQGDLEPASIDFGQLIAVDDFASDKSEHLFFALGLYRALSSIGRWDQADERFRRYVSYKRRERYDLRPAISMFGLPPDILSRLLMVIHSAEASGRKDQGGERLD